MRPPVLLFYELIMRQAFAILLAGAVLGLAGGFAAAGEPALWSG